MSGVQREGPASTNEAGADGSEQELVLLDRLGTVRHVAEGDPVLILTIGLPEGAEQRLLSRGDAELTEDLDRLHEAQLVLVSTRVARPELSPLLARLRNARCPVVALTHTGGESLAVEIVRSGAAATLAEGNEAGVWAVLGRGDSDGGLVEVYDRQLARSRLGADLRLSIDPVTGLASRAAFEQHLEELALAGDLPRIGFVRILNLIDGPRLSRETVALVRKRLAALFRPAASSYGVELFTLDGADFAVLGPTLSPNHAQQLGLRLASMTENFAPSGQLPLLLAMGHAGADVATEPVLLRELAQRALEAATLEKRSAVVNAEALSLDASGTTELEAASRLVAYVERWDPHPEGHGTRVAELAAELAWRLGIEGPARTRVQLAALLHDVGKAGLPPAAIAGPDGLDGGLLEAYRSHPVRSAEYLRAAAGPDIAAAVRAHHERWDGQGFPDGLQGLEIPLAARIIAVANAYDRLVHSVGRVVAVETLYAESGTGFDPEVVEAATALLLEPQPVAG